MEVADRQSRAVTSKSSRSGLFSPVTVVFVLSLVLMAFSIFWVARYRPFNSDDLYWQQAIRTWKPFGGHLFYFGTKDIFVILAPFFAVTERLFNPSRRLMVAETMFLTLGTFTLFYFSSLYFLRKLLIRATYVTLLPFAWLASFGYPLVQNYLNTDWRTYGIGFSFATFALVAAVTNGDLEPLESWWGRLATALAVVLTGVLMYSDPYYTYFTVGPLVIFGAALLWWKKIGRGQFAFIYASIAASYVVSKIVAIVCMKAGIHIVGATPSIFVGWESLVSNILSSLHGMFDIFQANFLGHKVTSTVTAGYILNAVLLIFILWQLFTYFWMLKRAQAVKADLPRLWAGFFVLTMVLIFLVYTSSTLAADSNNFRFYIEFVYCAATLFAIALGLMGKQGRAVFGGLLIVATLANLAFLVLDTKFTPGEIVSNRANKWNFAVIDAVEAQGMTKGYTGYWDGNINTYLSDEKVTFLPTLCAPDGVTAHFRWLIDGGQFDKPASKSFYMINPDFAAPGLCPQSQLDAQFGPPQSEMMLGNKLLLFYNYDIGSRMRTEQY
jgi:hypothetical protein